jgi:dihydroorotate dehydrogenase
LIYKLIIRPFLFLFDAEKVHDFTFLCLRYFIRLIYNPYNSKLETNLFGIDFPNPVGLAAGLDKNARLVSEFSSLGFGFVEIGTVTPFPQKGNPKKRLFRIVDQEAIINRMGFNNDGVKKIAKRLRKKGKIIVGGNIGKNKNTTFERKLTKH